MFFGLFSSILPYIIAAGIYILYLAFSLIQPFFSDNSENIRLADGICLDAGDLNLNKKEVSGYYYFHKFRSEKKSLKSYKYPLSPSASVFISDQYFRKYVTSGTCLCFQSSLQILSGLYLRPPPLC